MQKLSGPVFGVDRKIKKRTVVPGQENPASMQIDQSQLSVVTKVEEMDPVSSDSLEEQAGAC